MKGIDISSGSGNVDFHALKRSGYDFVICRAGWGSSVNQKDDRFDDYILLAHDAGLHVGAYWFIYARTIPEAQENGRCFAELCDKYSGLLDMPLWIDYENDSTRYYQQMTGCRETKEFATGAISVAALECERRGWYTGYYVNLDYYKNHIDSDQLKHFALWLALWRSPEVLPELPWGIWQYAGDTKISEASGGVDLNLCGVDYPSAIRAAGLNGFDKQEVLPDVLSIYGKNIIIHENGTWEFS